MGNPFEENEAINYEDKLIVVSVSGGKDSTAMCLHLFEQGYDKDDFVRVFADTGWESEETYRYLKEIERVVSDANPYCL